MGDISRHLEHGADRTERRDDEPMRRWRNHRLGQFVHFGLYSVPAGTWKGQTVDFAAEFLPKSIPVSREDWATRAADFSLPRFDAEKWAAAAKAAGAGYVTVTTKHHEGFCLWPSEYTDFHIGATPFKRDLLGELVSAYNKEGIDVVLYYSVLDWNHPDWRYKEETEEDKEAGKRFRAYALNQLLELAKRYPTVKGFWFDGTWDESVKTNGWWTHLVEKELKRAIPGCLVNSRLRADEFGNRHYDANGNMMGDFESGFERRLPDPWNEIVTTRDWEACMTIPEHTWGYHAGDWATNSRKDWRDIVSQLAHTVSRGGNFLLNVGPRGDGAHDPNDLEVTRRVGEWVGRHIDAIRGAGPDGRLTPPPWGFVTLGKDGRTHAIVTRFPPSGRVRIEVPAGKHISQLALDTVVASAETIELAPTAVELRLKEIPDQPICVSFQLADGKPVPKDVNPDVVN